MSTLDESEIRSVLCRERWARDTSHWRKMRECYHPDPQKTLIDLSWYTGNIDGFISGSKEMASKEASMLHVITPMNIEVRGTLALAESLGQVMCRFDVKSNEYDLTSWCRYFSRLEKVDGRWKMLSLEPIYLRDDIKAVGNAPPLDFDRVAHWPRKSYRYIAWHIMQRGVQPRTDLPGEDDKESVDRLRLRCGEWLESASGE